MCVREINEIPEQKLARSDGRLDNSCWIFKDIDIVSFPGSTENRLAHSNGMSIKEKQRENIENLQLEWNNDQEHPSLSHAVLNTTITSKF